LGFNSGLKGLKKNSFLLKGLQVLPTALLIRVDSKLRASEEL
jgi:hypothetical protein